MKKQQGHGLKTSLTVGALSSRPLQHKPTTAAAIEFPFWWWDDGTGTPKLPKGYGE
jgi:hypothetical protein